MSFRKTKMERVDKGFWLKIKIVSERTGIPKTEVTRRLAKSIDLKDLENDMLINIVKLKRRRKK